MFSNAAIIGVGQSAYTRRPEPGQTALHFMRDAAVAVRDDVIVLCHGGPIAEPDDAAYVLERTTGVVGFFGASSMERLPTEVAMTENMKRFKSIGGMA